MISNLNFFESMWLFFAYSFAGWVLETIIGTIKQKKLVNKGFVNGPFCITYGVASVLLAIGLQELNGFWLFVFSAIYATIIEWICGKIIEKIYHERWWNYSNVKWNLDGYICLPISLIWGTLGFISVKWTNKILLNVFDILPKILTDIVIWVLLGMLVADILASYILSIGKSRKLKEWNSVNNKFVHISYVIEKWLGESVSKRISKAYPTAEKVEKVQPEKKKFAQECGFYKVTLLFIIGSFLGDIIETIFCRVTEGVWMSRSSVVIGPFSIVWGLAIAAATAMLYKYKDRDNTFLFFMGTFLGGAYEYLCSVFTEIVFGKVFWDYSKIPFNLGGRINLLYCFFWGFAAVVWFKKVYPVVSSLIESIPMIAGKTVTWILIIFMCINIGLSCLALIRYDERENGLRADESWQIWMDKHYDDVKMEKIYPNAKVR